MKRLGGARAGALLAGCLLARGAAAQPAVSATDVEEARKHYARGVELYEQHADTSALAELERAYRLAPNWKVLYELGVVELAVHDFASSLGHFETYLAQATAVTDPKDAISTARRQEVVDRIAKLRLEVATIAITAPAGAEVKLDDVTVATAPLDKPVVVNPGHHKLGATKDGLTSESRMLSVAGGDKTSVDLVIAPPAPPPPAPVAQVEPPPPAPVPSPPPAVMTPEVPAHRASPYPLWVGWLATGALATGAIVTGVEALSANTSLTNAKNAGPSTAGALNALSSKARGFGIASDVMTGGAVIAGGATIYFALRPSGTGTGTGTGSVSAGIGVGSLALRGTF